MSIVKLFLAHKIKPFEGKKYIWELARQSESTALILLHSLSVTFTCHIIWSFSELEVATTWLLLSGELHCLHRGYRTHKEDTGSTFRPHWTRYEVNHLCGMNWLKLDDPLKIHESTQANRGRTWLDIIQYKYPINTASSHTGTFDGDKGERSKEVLMID